MSDAVSKSYDELGRLAMQFRGTHSEATRRSIASKYAAVVTELIREGGREVPPPEDQLPDAWMPPEFVKLFLVAQKAG